MSLIQTIGAAVGTVGAVLMVLGAITWFFGKNWYLTWLKRAADKELVRFTAALEARNTIDAIRFGDVNQKRLEVLGDVFGKLKRAQADMAALAFPYQQIFDEDTGRHDPVKSEQAYKDQMDSGLHEAAKSFNAFYDSYYPRRIWMPKNVCDRLDALAVEFRSVYTGMEHALRWADNDQPVKVKTVERIRDRAWHAVEKTIVDIAEEIENEFRALAGSES